MLIDHSSRVNIQVVVFAAHEGLVALKLCIGLSYVGYEGILATLRWIWHIFRIIVVIRNVQTALFRSRRTGDKLAH